MPSTIFDQKAAFGGSDDQLLTGYGSTVRKRHNFLAKAAARVDRSNSRMTALQTDR